MADAASPRANASSVGYDFTAHWIGTVLGLAILVPALLGQEPTRTKDLDWPTIRGPAWNGRSLEIGIADSWPLEGPPVLWTRDLGQGYSAFIAWDKWIATQFQDLSGQYLICLFAETGATKWQYHYGWAYDPAGVYPGPRSTPVYDNGFVYFTSPTGLVGCLNADSGQLVWSIELEKSFEVKVPGFGYSCSPIVLDDKIILPVGSNDASLVALDKKTGKTLWKGVYPKPIDAPTKPRRSDSSASYSSVYPISFQGRSCVVGTLQNAIVCHDSETGELVLRYDLSSGYDEHSAWPIYEEPYLWITGPFQRGSELLKITGDASQPIRTVRRSRLLSNDIFSSVLYDGALFGFDLQEAQAKTHRTSRGIFRCLDFQSGKELWSVGNGRLQRSPSNTNADDSAIMSSTPTNESLVGHATVLVADGKLILMNDLGELILARASREKYEELSRTRLLGGEICWTQPAISRLRLFVRNHSRAVCVYLGEPDLLSPQLKEKAIPVSQIPQGKFRDISSILLGVEPEYMFDLPSIAWLWRWYLISIFGILASSCAIVQICVGLIAFARTQVASGEVSASSWLQSLATWSFWILAFVLGALGTTVLSHWEQEFIFTWHVCLYVAWHVAIANMSKRTEKRKGIQRLQSIGALLFLLITCLIYFLLCRRLSLLFEWAFLGGFFAAVPFNLAGKSPPAGWPLGPQGPCGTQARGSSDGTYCSNDPTSRLKQILWTKAWQLIMTGLGFSAFYWSSVAILYFR